MKIGKTALYQALKAEKSSASKVTLCRKDPGLLTKKRRYRVTWAAYQAFCILYREVVLREGQCKTGPICFTPTTKEKTLHSEEGFHGLGRVGWRAKPCSPEGMRT